MAAYTLNDWLIIALAFFAGLLLGMALLAGGKWKRRYREEAKARETLERDHRRRVDELEAENERLRREGREMDSLRRPASRDEARRRPEDERGPI